MKKTISIVLLLLFTIGMYAQEGINYKALIKDNLGAVVANETIDVKFTIIADTGPTNVYLETHTGVTTDANGIVILTIGDGTTSDTFTDIAWGVDIHSLKVEIDIEQDSSFVDMGTTQFMAVPYAKTATELTGGIDQGYIADLEAQIAALDAKITSFHTPAAIGDIRDGGVVFWVDPADNTHGLVCAFSDYATLEEWGCHGTDLPSVPNVPLNGGNPVGPGAEIGDGFTNTINILNDCPTAPAALAARSYGPEWFLPSAKELNEMFTNKATLAAVPGFTAFVGAFYWSSTEYNLNDTWISTFAGGQQGNSSKDFAIFIRAVRAF